VTSSGRFARIAISSDTFTRAACPGGTADDSQEINWRAVCLAIADTGFTGYLAHEFEPTRDR
jgi:hydroxypyruvate isomerase